MFGHKDRRDDTSLFPRTLSLITIGAPAGYAGMKMLSWMNTYGSDVKSFMGLKIHYPTNTKKALTGVWDKVSSLFANTSGGIFDPVFNKNMDYYIRSMTDHNLQESEQFVSAIKEYRKTLSTLQTDMTATIRRLIYESGKLSKAFERGSTVVPHLVPPASSLWTVIHETDKYNYWENLGGMKNIINTYKSFLIKHRNENVFERIYRRIIAKHHILSIDVLDDETKLDTFSIGILRDLRDELRDSIREVRKTLPVMKNFDVVRTSKFNDCVKNVRHVMTGIKDVFEPNKFIKTLHPPSVDFVNGTIDVKAALEKFPSVNVLGVDYSADFMNSLFKKMPKGFGNAMRNALNQSGARKIMNPFISKAARDLKIFDNISEPQLGRQLHKLAGIFERNMKTSAETGGIVHVKSGMQPMRHSNKLIFELILEGPSTFRKNIQRTKIRIPFIIPKHLLYQTDAIKTGIIPYPHQHVMEIQVNTILDRIKTWIGLGLDEKTSRNVQGTIYRNLNNIITGVPYTGNLFEDFSKATTFSTMFNYLKSRGGYVGKGEILEQAWGEMAKWKSDFGGGLIHLMDLETTEYDGREEITNLSITTIRKIVGHPDVQGNKQIKLDWQDTVTYDVIDTKGKPYGGPHWNMQKATIGLPRNRWTKEAKRIFQRRAEKITKPKLIKMLAEKLSTGKIVGKAVMFTQKGVFRGDIPNIRELVQDYISYSGVSKNAKTGLLSILRPNMYIDMQKLVNAHITDIPPKYARGAVPIESTFERMKDIFRYWEDNGMGDISAFFKKTFNNWLYYAYNKNPLANLENAESFIKWHDEKFDALITGMYTVMVTEGRWNSLKSLPDWMAQLKKMPMPKIFKKEYLQALGSPAAVAKGAFLGLDAEAIFPSYEFRAAASPMYQALNAVKAFWTPRPKKGPFIEEWFNKDGMIPLPFVSKGTEEAWDGMKDYYRGMATFLSPHVGDGEVWMRGKVMKSINVENKGFAAIIVDTLDPDFEKGAYVGKIYENADKVNSEAIPIGTLSGKRKTLYVKDKVRILAKELDKITGKWRIEYSIIRPGGIGMKAGLFCGAKGIVAREITGELPMRVDAAIRYNMFGKGDTKAIIEKLLGHLALWAYRKPKRLHAVKNAIEKGLKDGAGRQIAEVSITAYNTLQFHHHLSGTDWASFTEKDTYKLFKQIFQIEKDLEFFQDRPIWATGNAKIKELWTRHKGYYPEANIAITDMLRRWGGEGENSPVYNSFMQAWMDTMTDADGNPANVKYVAGAIKNFDKAKMHEILNKYKAANIVDVLRILTKGATRPQTMAGMMSTDNAFIASDIPQMGTRAGTIKIGQYSIQSFKHRPGGQKYYEKMLQDINAQSAHKIGAAAMQLRVGSGMYFQDTGRHGIGVDILDLMDKIKRDKGREWEQWSLAKLLTAKPINSAELRAANFQNVAGEVMTMEKFQTLKKTVLKDEVANAIDISGRIFRRQDLDFLQYLNDLGKGGYGYIRHEPAKIVTIPGYNTRSSAIQMFGWEMTPLSQTGYLGGGDFVLLSRRDATAVNLLKKIWGASYKGQDYTEDAQKMWDLLLSAGPIKKLRNAFVPGMNSMLQLGRPFIRDSNDEAFGKYLKDTVIEYEGFTNSGWIKKHAKEFKEAADKLTTDDLETVAKYIREYDKMVPAENQMPQHPSYDKIFRNKTIKIAGIRRVKMGELVNEMQKDTNKFSKTQLLRLYIKAIKKGLLPEPAMMFKPPYYGIGTQIPFFNYFRHMDFESRSAETITRIHALEAKFMGADFDGDNVQIQLVPPDFKALIKAHIAWRPKELGEKGLWLLNTSLRDEGKLPGGITLKGETAEYFWNWEKMKLEAYPVEEADKKMKTYVGNVLKKTFGSVSPATYRKKVEMIKTAPAPATKILFSMMTGMERIRNNWKRETWQNLFNRLSDIGEWGGKQKVISESHRADELYHLYDRVGKPGVAAYLERSMKGTNPRYPGLEGQLDPAPPEVIKALKPSIPHDLVNKQSFLAVWAAVSRRDPRIPMFGTTDYGILLGSNRYIYDLVKANIAGHYVPDIPTELQIPQGIPFDTVEDSYAKGFKRMMKNALGAKTTKNLFYAGAVAGVALGAYLAINFFRPDQSSHLGHMPGKGGEYWDWSFTKPEMDWDYLMNTPFQNIHDRDKAYLRMDDPRYLNAIMNRERKVPQLYAPKKDEIKPVIYNRSVFEF